MKHGLLKKCVLLLLGILLSSCASAPYNIQNQTAIPKNLYKTYNKYYISWLDLGKDDWKKYNYPSQKEWEEFIYDGNINGLRVWMKDKFRGKELIFAGSEDKNFPKTGDLYIRFDVTGIERKYNASPGSVDYLNVNIKFFDVQTREEIYSASVITSSYGWGPGGWSFGGRLMFCIQNLCSFVYDTLNN